MAGYRWFVFEFIEFVIAPQGGRVIAMGVSLTIVAKETVKPLLGWITGGPGIAQTPFTKGAGYIAFL